MVHPEQESQSDEKMISIAIDDHRVPIVFSTGQRVRRWDQWVNTLLAAILFLAASLKTYQLAADPTSLAFGVIHSQYVMMALIQAEVVLASWLLINDSSRLRLIIAMLCFSVFATAAVYEAYRSLASCGCFGMWKVSPKITAGFDVLAVALLRLTRPRHGRSAGVRPQRIRLLGVLTVAVLASGILWTAFVLKVKPAIAANRSSATDDLVVLEPESWVNKPFELFDEIEGGDQLRSGRWMLVFYHYDCDSCLQAIPLYMSIATSRGVTSTNRPAVAFIAMPPLAPVGLDPVSQSPNYIHLILRPDHDWFATTPVVAAVEDGKVLWARDGENAVHPPVIPQWR